MIKRNLRIFKEIIVFRLYRKLVRPHLHHAVQAWHPYFYLRHLQGCQRRATCLIHSLKDISYGSKKIVGVWGGGGGGGEGAQDYADFDNLAFSDFF